MELTGIDDSLTRNSSTKDSIFLIQTMGFSGNNFTWKSVAANIGSNVTSSHINDVNSKDKRWIFLGLFILPVWILFGNLLVLISVIGFRHLRTLSNWVIASLAFTDFLLAVTVVPLGIYQLVIFHCFHRLKC